jgi:hypothetical protein
MMALALAGAPAARAQDGQAGDPAAALSAALTAACRGNEVDFANYLTAENAAAYRALPEEQRSALLRRFSLTDGSGKPLLSTDDQNHRVVRCESPAQTAEFRFGATRLRENLAFIPVTVVDSQRTQFGLVRENGGWRLLSLGLVLLDIPQLSKQWAEEDLATREDAAVTTLHRLADAIASYRRAFGKLPESLAQLGPAPKNEISPDQASLVDKELAGGNSGGYQFRYTIVPDSNGNDTNFELAATPEDYGKSGQRSFFLDAEGKVHGADKHGMVAEPDDPLIASEKAP